MSQLTNLNWLRSGGIFQPLLHGFGFDTGQTHVALGDSAEQRALVGVPSESQRERLTQSSVCNGRAMMTSSRMLEMKGISGSLGKTLMQMPQMR